MSDLVRTWQVTRWAARCAAASWLAVAVPRLGLLGLVMVELDAIVSWSLTSAEMAARPALEAAGLWLGLTLFLAVAERAAAVRLLRDDAHAVLLRQPLTGAELGPSAIGLVAPLVAVVGVVWTVAHGLDGALVAGVPAAVATLAVALGAWRTLAVALVGGAAAVAAEQALPGAHHGLLALGWLPVAGWAWQSAPARTTGNSRAGGRPMAHPALALLHRDALAAWRTEPGAVWGALLWALPTGFVVGGFRDEAGWDAAARSTVAQVMLALGAWSALAVPAAAARALGRGFDPPHWPTRVSWRAGSLVVLALGALAPGWAAAAVAAPLGPRDQVWLGGHALALAAGAAWWVAARPGRPGWGSWPWFLAACLAAAVSGWPLPAIGLGAWLAACRALRSRRG